jgi:hypothetical protein
MSKPGSTRVSAEDDDQSRLRRTLAFISVQVFAAFLADGRPICVPGASFFGRNATVNGMWLHVAPKDYYEGFTTWGHTSPSRRAIGE